MMMRKDAEAEAREDLQKPIEQLVADVNEEVNSPGHSSAARTGHALKRTASLMGVVALEQREHSEAIASLTSSQTEYTIMTAELTRRIARLTWVLLIVGLLNVAAVVVQSVVAHDYQSYSNTPPAASASPPSTPPKTPPRPMLGD
jgi:hypothetical protein